MKTERIETVERLVKCLILFVLMFSPIIFLLFEEHEVSESIVTYVIHNPDGTQTHGSVVFNDNQGMLRPEVTARKGTSKLKAGYTTLSSNGTFEIISVQPYRHYYKGGFLSKHNRKKK